MRRTLILATVLAAISPAARADTPPPPPRLAQHWERRPSADDFARVYPAGALQQHISGHATMKCKVTESGALADCQLIEATPPDAGFGQAELALAPQFKMTAPQPAGGTVIVPVHFVAP